MNQLAPAPKYIIRAIKSFYEISQLITGVNDTNDKW
jgi:hypothetical protein